MGGRVGLLLPALPLLLLPMDPGCRTVAERLSLLSDRLLKALLVVAGPIELWPARRGAVVPEDVEDCDEGLLDCA